MKSFVTVKARQQQLLQKSELVKGLDQSLRSWYEDLPGYFKPEFPINQNHLPEGIQTEQLINLHFSYHANLAAIHSVFGHPWNLTDSPGNEGSVGEQVIHSTRALQEASRNIVLITRYISIDAYAPTW